MWAMRVTSSATTVPSRQADPAEGAEPTTELNGGEPAPPPSPGDTVGERCDTKPQDSGQPRLAQIGTLALATFKQDSTFCGQDSARASSVPAGSASAVAAVVASPMGSRKGSEGLDEVDAESGSGSEEAEPHKQATGWTKLKVFKKIFGLGKHEEDATEAERRLAEQKKEARDHIRRAMMSTKLLADDPWVPLWEVLLLAGTLYFEVSVTLNDVMHNWTWENSSALDGVFSMVFLVDILVRMNMAIHMDGYRLEDSAEIIAHYATSWLIPDLLAGFPFDLIAAATGNMELHQVFYHLRLIRIFRVPTYFAQVNHEAICARYIWVYYQIVPLVTLLFWTCAVLHFFIMVRLFQVRDRDTSFIRAGYWVLYTVTSVGYGDVDVNGDAERLWACFLFITGVFANAAIIGKLTKVMSANDIKSERKAKMMETLAVMQYYAIPSELQQEVLAFQNHILHHNVGSSYAAIISGLPASMQGHIGLYVRIKFITAVPMFSSACADSRVALAEALVNMVYGPGQYIIKAGEIGEEMFFLGHGYADVISPDGTYLITIKKGGFFGEVALLVDTKRTASVRALTYCDCFRLDKVDFHAILDSFPDFKESVQSEIQKREALQQVQDQAVLKARASQVSMTHSSQSYRSDPPKQSTPVMQNDAASAEGGSAPPTPQTAPKTTLFGLFKTLAHKAKGEDKEKLASEPTGMDLAAESLGLGSAVPSRRTSTDKPSYSGDITRAIQRRMSHKRNQDGASKLRKVLKNRALQLASGHTAGPQPLVMDTEDCDATMALAGSMGTSAADAGSVALSPLAMGDRRTSEVSDISDMSGSGHPAPLPPCGRLVARSASIRRSVAWMDAAGAAGPGMLPGSQPAHNSIAHNSSGLRRGMSMVQRLRTGAPAAKPAPAHLNRDDMSEIRQFMQRIDARMQTLEHALHCKTPGDPAPQTLQYIFQSGDATCQSAPPARHQYQDRTMSSEPQGGQPHHHFPPVAPPPPPPPPQPPAASQMQLPNMSPPGGTRSNSPSTRTRAATFTPAGTGQSDAPPAT
eukprot:TRINITY_DN59952_c0_g1_i1.p1 TRINITY_DN59952_c0_g1~~TRINITY_DN59952_c0_g1_i1.p1  ORF type:complete len:1033 (+),score=216.74 TRINITY_DN59952_c0_g1_i1:134-3232(+)